MDTEVFEGFIERLLLFRRRGSEPKSVIFMEDASLYFSLKIDEMHAGASGCTGEAPSAIFTKFSFSRAFLWLCQEFYKEEGS